MATTAPTPNPQQGPPDTPGAPQAAPPGDQQANPLQAELADITRRVLLLSQQNPTLAPQLQAVFNILRLLLRKVLMTPQQPTPQQGPQQM
jgi:hypothetical protein